MDDWIKLGLRFINLTNVTEVHIRERPCSAKVFFNGGAVAELDEDDTRAFLSVLEQRAVTPEEEHRTVIPAPKRV